MRKEIKMIRNSLAIVLIGCAALGWWGALYPQFTLLSGTYEVIYEEDHLEDMQDKRELYWQILSADRSQIRMKSKILEDWKALREARSE